MKYRTIAILMIMASSINLQSYADDQQPDNTGRNVRDRNGYNPTAEDQSNRRSAIKSTAKLRREIMRTKGLSVNGQNVKIIDENGCVTLRGPVNSEREKLTIEGLAHKCFGENVKNELEVKTP